jgi:hypothetical protein
MQSKTMDTYKFGGGEERKAFGPLAPGDYSFTVTECGEPYQKENGNWVLQARLSIQPGGETVFATPWSGMTRDGKHRDGIGDFLISVNRAPEVGDEPEWRKIAGAKGKCRLKVETAQQGAMAGKEVNKVAFFHKPKQVGPGAEQSVSTDEFTKARAQSAVRAGATQELEPDDIPF